MHPTFKRISQAAIATAVPLLFCSGAEGGGVGLGWDPIYGPGDPGLFWTGTAHFSLLDSCLVGAATSSGSVFVPNSGCNMTFDSATVNLSRPSVSSTVETLTFVPADGVGSVIGMEIRDVGGRNLVVGIDTGPGPIGFERDTASTIYAGPFWISFQSLFHGLDPVTGHEGSCPDNCIVDPTKDSNPAFLTLTTTCGPSEFCSYGPEVFVEPRAVPEPETMGLVLGALGAGWLARRRRRVT